MIPQYIYIALLILTLVVNAIEHGKPKRDYNINTALGAMALNIWLMYEGGFLDPLINK